LTEQRGQTANQGGLNGQHSGPDSHVRVIGNASGASSTFGGNVRTYTSGSFGSNVIRGEQSQPSSAARPEGQSVRERVYRIYGNQSGSSSDRSPASPPRDHFVPGTATTVTSPPSRSAPIAPSTPPLRFNSVREVPSAARPAPPASAPAARVVPGSPPGQSSGGTSGNQDSRSTTHGRAGR